jgi:hypothetical protein
MSLAASDLDRVVCHVDPKAVLAEPQLVAGA